MVEIPYTTGVYHSINLYKVKLDRAGIKTGNVHFWSILNANFLQRAHVLACTLRCFIKFASNLPSKLNVCSQFKQNTFNGTTVLSLSLCCPGGMMRPKNGKTS
ncbi:MAG: hypothetical protein COV52_00765 [Gammaproteobacteria bacterium CG11_big_fil_rev_8_21_14_0_20_46_22]|nr:MAG: hypothetical protein COW05_06585 [Gammaproteobacteria bacterium CG12_big_fil_rev_8_21_14_0_65_46_12]PIR12076.1 MAG: hypothetical protein COV52_00765 [Gammaproteobacteria bacterium CG11_big_fil_rev_8_21_14_0_20_46_22]